ncbi:MAG: AraC family transcriptional regulator [Lachnospiraceae bacterium]|nr:AraC family transcriptional regulator [Lachnospiraceae bacterium]
MFNYVYPVIASQACFPFYLSGVGTASPEYHVLRENGLVSHQILFTLDGEGILNIDNKSFVNKKGTIFYVKPGISHEYYPLGGQWTTCWVVFRGDYLAEIMQRLGFPDYICKKPKSIDNIKRLFDMIYASAKSSGSMDEKCSLLVYEYILAVRDVLLLNEDTPANSIIKNAITYIDKNFNKDISLHELSELCGISRQHFCRVFKKKMGMRPLEYLTKKRISEAKVLLINTNKSIAAIGEETGYNDANYFGMVFKKYEGISPGEYRKIKKYHIIL